MLIEILNYDSQSSSKFRSRYSAIRSSSASTATIVDIVCFVYTFYQFSDCLIVLSGETVIWT